MGLGKWKTKPAADRGNVATEGSFLSRKQQRKQAKELKKIQKIAFSQRKKVNDVIQERLAPSEKKNKKKKKADIREFEIKEIEDDVKEVEGKPEVIEETNKTGKKRRRQDSDDEDGLTYEQYLEEVKEKARERQMSSDLAQEDEIAIHRYSRLLGLQKKKNLPSIFVNEGLDSLIEFCDSKDRNTLLTNEGEAALEEFEDEEIDEEDEGQEEDEDMIDLSEGEEAFTDEEVNEEDIEEEEEDMEADFIDEDEEEEEKTVTQDIYGRDINKNTGELIKFDPRAAKRKLEELNSKTAGDSDARQKIDRTITGIINRLSDSTLAKSKEAFAELWQAYSKNDVKSSLAKIVWKMMDAPYRLQDSLISTYAVLLGLIHAVISSEISSHFVEEFLVDYVKSIEMPREQDDKAMENKTVLIINLMNFRIIKPSLVLEIFDKLIANFNIDNLQLINTLSTYSYKTMKKKCWTQLCEKVTATEEKLNNSPLGALPRAKFLGEKLAQLKKSAPENVDFSITDQHLKILQRLLKNEKVEAEKELGMGLEDLLLAEQRGRWWIVGSAFRLPRDTLEGTHLVSNKAQKGPIFSEELMNLAKKANMNTTERRNIFCSIAAASNEDDAFERVIRLSLKGIQEREIIYVIIQMLLKEKTYNPYYPALVTRFCEYDQRFKVTAQYAIWDRIRESALLKPKARTNFALFIHQLIYQETLSITILKVVEWGSLSPIITGILRKVFTELAKCPPSKLKRIFAPVLVEKKKDPILADGLRLFLQLNFSETPIYQKVEEWFCGF